jgi:hypothetical protein
MARSAGRVIFILRAASQLLGVGAAARGARSRKLNVEAAIRATGRAVFPATGVWVLAVYNTFLIWIMAVPCCGSFLFRC